MDYMKNNDANIKLSKNEETVNENLHKQHENMKQRHTVMVLDQFQNMFDNEVEQSLMTSAPMEKTDETVETHHSLPVTTNVIPEGFQILEVPDFRQESQVISYEIAPNKPMIFKIKTNPSTGYRVFLKTDFNDLKLIKFSNLNAQVPNQVTTNDYYQEKCQDGMTGVPKFCMFKFEASDVGQEKIYFENKRSWSESDATQVEINLTIQ